MIKLSDNEIGIIEVNECRDRDDSNNTCEPYCDPNCDPTCNPVCSPSCYPCYPGNHCNPETFYCAPDREDDNEENDINYDNDDNE